jgi:Spy/CpxP family protein refolding chaperone
MARALKEILTLCLILGLTSIAPGQQQDRRQPPQQQPSVLGPVLSNPDVQKELKLSEEQISKLKDALDKMWGKYREDFAKSPPRSPEEQQKKMREISSDGNKIIAGILDAKQLKRYRQIEWQMAGIGALGDPQLQDELKLSDEQKKKLEGIFKDAEKRMQELYRNRETSPEKYQALAKDVEEKANGVLTEEQQKNLKKLKGSPFQFSRQPPPPPRER